MHAAPSVTYPVGRSRFAGAVLAALALLGLAAGAAFTLQSDAFGWRQTAVFSALAACSALAALGWWRSPQGLLHWEAGGWRWEQGAGGSAGQVRLALDLQSRMLLRWRGDGGERLWLWTQQEAKSADWTAFRRAIYSRASQEAPHPDTPPAGGGVAEQ